jgi:MFS family permease
VAATGSGDRGARPPSGVTGTATARPADRDVVLLFATRVLRMFGYGFLAVVLVLYLDAIGLSGGEVGLLLGLTLLGDAAVSLWLTTHADRLGRRRVLVAGALLMLAAGVVFAATPVFVVLLAAATLGVVSPSGNEVGPFLAVEQAALTGLVPDRRRTSLFARYQLAGSLATAAGTLAAGALVSAAISAGTGAADAYRLVILGYAAIGLGLAALVSRVSSRVEVPPAEIADATIRDRLGLHRSRPVVLRLSALFALDAFAGGFVVLSFVAFWFNVQFGVDAMALGLLLSAANLLAGFSALAAGRLAARFGLVRTMVFTHLPSNVLLMLVPLMPTLPLAAGVLLARFAISQMDVPTRQSYTMAIVAPDERSAAAGVTGIARSLGVAAAPLVAGPLYASAALAGLPFLLAGGLKIVYDLLLYRSFRALRPPEEREAER